MSQELSSLPPQEPPSKGGLKEASWFLGGIFIMTLVLWASAFVAIPVALETVPPFTLIMGRLTLSSIIFFPLLVMKANQIRARWRKDWKLILAMALTGTTGYVLALTFGQRTVGAGETSLIVNTTPLITGMMAAVFLKEPFHKRMIYGALIALLGVAFLVLDESESVVFDPNAFLILAAAVSASLYYICIKKLSAHYSALTLSALTICIGTLAMAPFAGNFIPGFAGMSQRSSQAILYLGAIIGVLPYIGWAYILSKLPAGKAALYLYFIPVIATALGWAVLGETITWDFVFAGLLVVLGVMIGTGAWKNLGLAERPKRLAPKTAVACKDAP